MNDSERCPCCDNNGYHERFMDEAAIAAMQGMIANGFLQDITRELMVKRQYAFESQISRDVMKEISRLAYKQAVAMWEARP